MCGPNDECPPGLMCQSGVCRVPGTADAPDTNRPGAPILSMTTPPSPSNQRNVMVLGSAEPSTTINIYSDAACSMQLGTGTSAALTSPGIAVTVGQNGTTALYATATNQAGNASNCSSPLSYTEDELPPGVPALTTTQPNSPSRSTMPTINGTADANVLVMLYTTDDCSGTALAMGTATGAGTFSIKANVAAGATTQFAAQAQDAAGNKSACSGFALTYIHDATAVSAPTFSSTNPASPSNSSLTPMIIGVAEASITVKLYTDPLCTSSIAGMTTSDSSGNFTVSVTVGANSTTTFYGISFDPASSQYSSCSLSGITYIHDNTPPGAPTVTGSSPTSPTNSANPNVTGGAEANSTVNVYTANDCSGTAVGTGTATAGNTYSVAVPLPASTTFYATATDAAGNTSACSTSGYLITLDTTAPAAPVLSTTAPTSPSTTSTTPIVIGTAESGSTVNIYRTSDCTGPSAGSGAATPGFGISITVPSNSSSPLTATATDSAGNVSMCATAISYVHDSIAPNPPALTSTTPGSPANANSPVVNGMTEAGAKVQLYTDATCTTTIGSLATADGAGAFTVTVGVSNDTTNQFYGKATDTAGNVSTCGTGLTYVEDSTPPGTPTLNSLPPSNSVTMPTLTGAAEPGATVNVYTLAACGGTSMGSTTAAGDGTYSIQMTVGMNSSTTFSVKAVDAAGNPSGCSNNMTYIHDNMMPGQPTALASTPGSPAQSSSPSITGMAENNSTVRLFTNPTCSTGVAGTGTASGTGSFSIPVSVGAASTTTFYATATDAANNSSACSAAFVTYTQDSVAPAVPSSMTTVPGSPGNALMPSVHGNTEANANVKLYSVAGCGSGLLNNGNANAAGAFAITITVGNGSTTNIYATATDAANNTSPCTSVALVYVEDSTPPATPSSLSTTPPSPANNTNPSILGTTEAGATVVAYSNSGCTTIAGSAVANGSGAFTIPVTVGVNTTVTFYLVATDAALNSTVCGAATIPYTDDNSAVATPTLTSTTPTSPSSTNTTPSVNGTTGNGFTIKMYTTSNCTGTFVQVTADGAGNFTVPETVTTNSTTTFYATATNLALTVSACSNGITYIHDSTAPNPPTGLGVTPTSPANNNLPTISGGAEGNSTVKLYTNVTCTSAVAASGTATGAGSFSIAIPPGVINDNTTTNFWATATDAAGNPSACSSSTVQYVEDSNAPGTPSITSTTPGGPSNNTNPTVNGTAEANSTVRLYTMAACAGPVLATGTAVAGNTFAIPITVVANTSTPLYARATDAALNPSACSAVFTYVNDSNPPGVPTGLVVNPVGPANNKNPVVSGSTSEAGATVRVYGNSSCNGTLYGSAVSTGVGAFAVTVTVGNDTTTTFYANATDGASNTSTCSISNVTYVDDATPPLQPTGLSANPAGPANNNNPQIKGTAEAGSTVKIYTNSTCTSAVAASGPATGGQFAITIPNPVIADNSTTNFYATATDAANNTSPCSSATVQYVEDSSCAAPLFSPTTNPPSPSKSSVAPFISGTAEAGATVTLYTDAACSSAVAGSGTATNGNFSIQVNVTADTATTFYGTATDTSGNMSACSASHVAFISDQTAPAFNGVTGATAIAKDTMTVQWLAATDMFTSGGNMKYEICMGTSPRACDSWATFASVIGSTSATISGLAVGQRYWVQVRAVDLAANTGAPATNTEVSDRTFGPGGTKQIAAGWNFTCALQSDGTVWCWGNGTVGQLGNGANSNSNVPVKVSNLTDVIYIAAGGSATAGNAHACAVKINGTVWCWGSNQYGQLGNGSNSPSNVPVQASGVSLAVTVGLGQAHTCMTSSNGNVYCWGLGIQGQLGNAMNVNSNTWVQVSGITTAKAVDAGNWHTCALLANGQVKCWGHGGEGELGYGGFGDTNAPGTVVSLAGGEYARALDVGEWHACVIIQSGQMRCWGGNQSGQLGNNSTANSATPVSPLLSGANVTKVKAISAGGDYNGGTFYGTTCAVRSDGNAYCAGQNGNGQLGNGNNTNQLIAVYANASSVSTVSVGHEHTCFLHANGTVQCTGNDAAGQLGNGANADQSTPVNVVGLFSQESGVQITGEYDTGCSRMSNGRVYCWGRNYVGQLGNNTSSSIDVGYPLNPVTQSGNTLTDLWGVAMYYTSGCALRATGNVVCWGSDSNWELGDGGGSFQAQAINVQNSDSTTLADAISVTTGFYHGCAVIVDGTVKCWGYNGYGELGNGTYVNNKAVPVTGITSAIAVVAQGYGACAILADGTVRCWGNGLDGALGNNATATSNVPVQVKDTSGTSVLVNAIEIGSGHYHSCALIAGGLIDCWGDGVYGMMGNNTTTTTNMIPVQANSSGYTHVAAGNYNTCGAQRSSLYCWGYNAYGAVGDGNNTTPVIIPTAVGASNAVQFNTGVHSSAIFTDGGAECWGQGAYGECADTGGTSATARGILSPTAVLYFP